MNKSQLTQPQLRFRGFNTKYNEIILNNEFQKIKSISGLDKTSFNCGTSNYIQYLDVFQNSIINRTTKFGNINIKDTKQNLILKNDILFTISSETQNECGLVSTYQLNNNVYLNSFCGCLRPLNKETDSVYFSLLLRNGKYRKYITKISQGSTRFNLHSDFYKMKLLIPIIKEQNKIATFFILIDKQIELLNNKLRLTKLMKKYYLNNIFILNKNIPQLRFREFSSEWIKSNFKSILKLEVGKRPINLNFYKTTNDLDIPYPIQSDIINKEINSSEMFFNRKYKNLMNFYSNEKNLLLTCTCNLGRTVWINLNEYVLDDKFFVIKPNNDNNLYFLKYLLDFNERKVKNTSQGDIIKQINRNYFKNIKINYCELNEQIKISNFFMLIDKQIKLLKNNLKNFKSRKKYYLNKIFL